MEVCNRPKNPRPIMLVSGHVRPIPGDLPVGGAARQAVKLSHALQKKDVEARIVTFRPRLRFPRFEMVEGVPVNYVNSLYWLLRYRGIRRVEAMLRLIVLVTYLARHRRKYDIIHIHTAATATGLAGVMAGKWLNKPTVLKITNSGEWHDLYRFYEASGLPLARRLSKQFRSATYVVALNDDAAHKLVDEGFHPDRIGHIPNGVELNHILPKPHYDANGVLKILYTGRLHASKGLDVLIEALACLPKNPAWHLEIVGSGPAQSQLSRQVDAVELSDQITFTGQVADVLPYLQRADIFVLPSSAEGISNALLESMAAGLPCIATDNAGNCRVLTHDDTGLLIPIRNAEALAHALMRLMNDANLRQCLGRSARRSVEENFSIDGVAEEYLTLYQRLCQR